MEQVLVIDYIMIPLLEKITGKTAIEGYRNLPGMHDYIVTQVRKSIKNKFMKKFVLIFICLFFTSSYGQKKSNEDKIKIKSAIVSFLKWYKENSNQLETSTIIRGFNTDSIKTGDSLVRIDMKAVDIYLKNLKKSNYISASLLNNLKNVYQSVSDSLIKYPVLDYFGPIGGLEADVIFGFEPEEILDHIMEGKFSKIHIIYNKALIKFDISKYKQYIFILTKEDNNWVIDYFGLDKTNIDRLSQ